MIKGLIVDIQRFSVHDGPGIRSVVFFKGCPLNCLWCQNPEAINPRPQLAFRLDKCFKCGVCSDWCPEKAIKKKSVKINEKKCNVSDGCTICMEACPSLALEIAGRQFNIDELIEIILKDKQFYEDSYGGVTCSGGEPTYQWTFVKKFLQACKKEGIQAAIETCGFFNSIIIDDLYDVCDIVLFDIKHLDENIHKKLTGKSNKLIHENLKKLIDKYNNDNKKQLFVRLPLIPTLNDSKEHLQQVEDFLISQNIDKLILLPYHSLYLQKIDRFRLKRKRLKILPFDKSKLDEIKNYFKKIEISIGG